MKKTITTIFTVALLFISFKSLTYSGSPDPGLSNAPGEGNCSGCHGSGTITSGTVWNSMNISVVGATLGTLKKDTTYTLNLTFSDPSSVKYGFQLCVLPAGANSSTSSLGTLISPTTSTQIVSTSTRDYLQHTSAGTSVTGGTKTWSFQWQTPITYVGGATFYVVVNASNNNSSSGPGDNIYTKTFSANISLPVNWLFTKVSKYDDDVTVNWATASEVNNWKFVVEKSTDMTDWTAIGEVMGEGNSSVINKYSFTEANVKEGGFYRIKQIDFDGKYSFSSIVQIENKNTDDTPEVTYNMDKLGFTIHGNNIKHMSVMDMNGSIVYKQSIISNNDVLPQFNKGLYIIKIETMEKIYYQKIVM